MQDYDGVTPLDRLLNRKQVLDRLGISRGTLYSRIKSGKLPSPLKLEYIARWRESDIRAVMAGTWIPTQA